jgi:hypothetical protein
LRNPMWDELDHCACSVDAQKITGNIERAILII